MTALCVISGEDRPQIPFSRSREAMENAIKKLDNDDTFQWTHTQLENMLASEGRELIRQLLQDHLELRALREQRVVVVDGQQKERQRFRADTTRKVLTEFGVVEVRRMEYPATPSKDDSLTESALHPMDASLNLPPERYSFGVQRIVAEAAAINSFDEVGQLVLERTGAKIGKRQLEEVTVRSAVDFQAFYESMEHGAVAVNVTDFLVITTDAKGIAMIHRDLREATRRAAEKTPRKLESRLSSGEKPNRKRMAQVVAVYFVSPHVRTAKDVRSGNHKNRPRPTRKRVWASVELPAEQVITQAFDLADRHDPERKHPWVVLVDGQPAQLQAVQVQIDRLKVHPTVMLDIIHVLEYLWNAGRAIHGESSLATEKWAGDRLSELLSGHSGKQLAETIKAHTLEMAERRTLTEAQNKQIDTACRYLAEPSRQQLMGYKSALEKGLPIATGVIEGACRYLVKDRMARTGARWSLPTAEAVLRLRALRSAGDFDAYWTYHLAQEQKRNHEVNYHEGKVPRTVLSRLRRVK